MIGCPSGERTLSYAVIEPEKFPEKQNKKLQSGNSFHNNVVIYRNVKYSGPLIRWTTYIKTYTKRWLLPLIICLGPWVSHGHDCVLEVLGLLYLFLMTPCHILLGLVLLMTRHSRIFLVKKYYPALDLSPRSVFTGKSLEMVTTIIMLKGKLDVNKLRLSFTTSSLKSCQILRKKIINIFGLRAFVKVPFCPENHIVEAPKEYLKYFLVDEMVYGKSALQTYVTKCASEKLGKEIPPWKITVIKLFSHRDREKTCCVLNFSHILLSDPQVNACLDNIFSQCIYPDEDESKSPIIQHFPPRFCDGLEEYDKDEDDNDYLLGSQENQQSFHEKVNLTPEICNQIPTTITTSVVTQNQCDDQTIKFEEPTLVLFKHLKRMSSYIQLWIYSNLYVNRTDFLTWISLQKKQFEFYGKSAIVKLIAFEFLVCLRKVLKAVTTVPQSPHWSELRQIVELVTVILRAVCFVPIQIFSALLFHYPKGTKGLKAGSRSNRSSKISWSPPISRDLLKNIKSRTGATTQSIVLTAIAASLKDYYSETNLPNPKRLGVMIPFVTGDLLSTNGFTTLDLPTEYQVCTHSTLKKVDSKLKSFARWKLLGNCYIFKYLPYILPSPLTNFLFQKIFRRYPILFTKLDLQPSSSNDDGLYLPHMSLWGQTVEEFCFWPPLQSKFCVSVVLVNYVEVLRVSVLSQLSNFTLDVVLTQKFTQNLNKIALEAGVPRNLIPYSRKCSPSSSNCSSPVVHCPEK